MPHQLRLILLTALITAGLVLHVHRLRSRLEPPPSDQAATRDAAHGRLQAPGTIPGAGTSITGEPFDSRSIEVIELKDSPRTQWLLNSFCEELDRESSQCFLVDERDASRVIGIEYVISEDRYRKLPDAERALWHSHHYEVSTGLMRLIGKDQAAVDDFARRRIDSYGKAWLFGMQGKPELGWSIKHDGEASAEILHRLARNGTGRPQNPAKNRADR